MRIVQASCPKTLIWMTCVRFLWDAMMSCFLFPPCRNILVTCLVSQWQEEHRFTDSSPLTHCLLHPSHLHTRVFFFTVVTLVPPCVLLDYFYMLLLCFQLQCLTKWNIPHKGRSMFSKTSKFPSRWLAKLLFSCSGCVALIDLELHSLWEGNESESL